MGRASRVRKLTRTAVLLVAKLGTESTSTCPASARQLSLIGAMFQLSLTGVSACQLSLIGAGADAMFGIAADASRGLR